MFVFRECSKFTSVFTLCALSVDRFMATFHQLGRYRQIRVGVAVCTSIWVACLVVSSPYWIVGVAVCTSIWVACLVVSSPYWIVGVAVCTSIWVACLVVSSPYWIVGVAVCTSIWVACLVVSSPYWIFGSTAERTRRTPAAPVATGSDVIDQAGNTTTAHALGSAYNEYLLASHVDPEFDQEYDLVRAFELDPGGDLNYDNDLDPEKLLWQSSPTSDFGQKLEYVLDLDLNNN